MPFTIVYKDQTISADDFNANFVYIGQGNLFPLGGNSLDPTNATYNLGSDSYRWNNVHVQTINLSGEIQRTMNLISEVNLTATTAAIDITGLNGETDELYEIIVNGVGYATCTVFLFPNSDSTTNNYGLQQVYGDNNLVVASRSLSYTSIYVFSFLYSTITAKYGKSKLLIYANNTIKMILSNYNDVIGNVYIHYCRCLNQVWNNSATLTSMKFTGFFDVGTNIQVFAKR